MNKSYCRYLHDMQSADSKYILYDAMRYEKWNIYKPLVESVNEKQPLVINVY